MISGNSPQGKIQAQAVTDENGLRKVGEHFCIAIGQGFGFEIGDKITVCLEGKSFKAIVSDLKQDRHTVDGIRGKDGSVIEFIVDVNLIPKCVRQSGSVGTLKKFSGSITEVEK